MDQATLYFCFTLLQQGISVQLTCLVDHCVEDLFSRVIICFVSSISDVLIPISLLLQYYKDTGSCDTESLSSHCSRPEDGIAQVTRLRPWTVQPGHRPSTGHRRRKDGGQEKTSSSGDFKVDGPRRYSGQSRNGSQSARRESQTARRESRQVWGESMDVRGGDADICDRRDSHEYDYGGNVDFCGDYSYRGGDHGYREGGDVYYRDSAGDHGLDHDEFLDLDVERDGLVSSDHEVDSSSQPWAVTEVQSDFGDLDPMTSSAIFEGGSLDVSTEVSKYQCILTNKTRRLYLF